MRRGRPAGATSGTFGEIATEFVLEHRSDEHEDLCDSEEEGGESGAEESEAADD